MSMNRRMAGFTIFEMVIVLIMVGILTAGLAPMLLQQHTNTMSEKDRIALENAKVAIVNYAISNGGIPDSLPIDGATGALVTPFLYPATEAASQPVGLMPPSDNTNTYAVSAFGVNNWGVFGGNTATNYAFRLDVNDRLKSSYIKNLVNGGSALTYDAYLAANTGSAAVHQTGDRVVFCQVVREQMALAVPLGPQVCQNNNSRTVAGVTTVCASTTPAAYVLFSAGSNRIADQENDDRTSAAALKTNRIYENDSRGINNSPGDDRYDDQVMSYPLSALARDCREKMGVSAEAMSCAPGEKFVATVTNNHSASVPYKFSPVGSPVVTVPPNSFTSYVNSCFDRKATVAIDGTTIQCGAPLHPCTLAEMDSNTDGRLDFMITNATTATYQ